MHSHWPGPGVLAVAIYHPRHKPREAARRDPTVNLHSSTEDIENSMTFEIG